MTLQLIDIAKTYHHKRVVDGVTLTFEPQKIYGLLGRNGAGKSTLLNMIANRIHRSNGQLTYDNKPLLTQSESLSQIYLTNDEQWYPANIRIQRLLHQLQLLYPDFDREFADYLCRAYQLQTNKRLKQLSTGYRSIAKLIIALCVPASYVFLDEPVLGLDANHRVLFNKHLLEAYERRPRTFVVSTHIIGEVASLLEEVIILDAGKIIAQHLVEDVQQKAFVLSGEAATITALAEDLTVIGEKTLGKHKQIAVFDRLPEHLPPSVSVTALSLQDYFVYLTTKEGEL